MVRTAAVVAHFDPDNLLDPTFRLVLEDLEALCDLIILVSTSKLATEEIPASPKIITICRPNIGYDFYSYRVGIAALLERTAPERVLLLNSSFLITRRKKFQETLNTLLLQLDDAEIVGATASRQWQWHLQSYLIAFRGSVLQSGWMQSWLRELSPRNTKTETILSGELGLSSAISTNAVRVKTLFTPSPASGRRAMVKWAFKSLTSTTALRVLRPSFWRALPQFNPTHFQAHELAQDLGLIKTELVRNNPHGLKLDWLRMESDDVVYQQIQSYVKRSGTRYQSRQGAMTTLTSADSPWPAIRILSSSPPRQPGVRVCVVVHIFYPELAHEIYTLLRNIVEPFDLIVTTPHEGAISALLDTFAPLASSVTIALSENRGRDVGPFIAVHRAGLLDHYDAILKLHSKRSTYSEQGQFWQQSLFRQLCGDSLTVMRTLELLRSGRAGIVGPHDYYLTHPHYWGANRATVWRLLQSLSDTPLLEKDVPLGFFAGTMFWFTPQALAPLHDIPDSLLNFEPEGGKQDGTLAHALERLFGQVARHRGLTVTSLAMAGRDMEDISTHDHTVPVLNKPPSSRKVQHS
ncbi:rhamnan synthesis F family protein [Achromobacter aegrifaciens]